MKTYSPKALKCFYDGIMIHAKKILSEDYFRDIRPNFSVASWNLEMATIRVSLPRRAGNSTLLIKLARNIKNSLVVTCNTNMFEPYKLKKIPCESISCPTKLIDRKYDVLLVDGAAYFTQGQISTLYNLPAKLFILIG